MITAATGKAWSPCSCDLRFDRRNHSSELLEAFVDEEAVESDGEGGDRPVNSDGENALVKGTADDYDYSDPFM